MPVAIHWALHYSNRCLFITYNLSKRTYSERDPYVKLLRCQLLHRIKIKPLQKNSPTRLLQHGLKKKSPRWIIQMQHPVHGLKRLKDYSQLDLIRPVQKFLQWRVFGSRTSIFEQNLCDSFSNGEWRGSASARGSRGARDFEDGVGDECARENQSHVRENVRNRHFQKQRSIGNSKTDRNWNGMKRTGIRFGKSEA